MDTTLNRPYNVLVVDDEEDVPPIFRQHLRRDVRQGRYMLHFANSGAEALRCLDDEPDIDLVVTDINMPEMDGLTLLERIGESGRNLRSVVLSAYGDMKNIRAAMNRGAFDFLVKPVDFEDMRVTIERSLQNLDLWRGAVASRDQLVSLNRDLEIAWRIQNSVLPRSFPTYASYDLHGHLEPARTVSGDFYDVIRLDGDRLGLVVADVSGKGVPAAMLMMSVRTLVRGLAIANADPGEVLSEVNVVLCEDNPLFNFVTMFFGVFDPADGSVTYANAGHDAPLLFGPGLECQAHQGDREVVLGLVPGQSYPVSRLELLPGQGMCVHTDGVSEAENVAGEMFSSAGIRDVLAGAGPGSLDAAWTVRLVIDAVRDFVGGALQSDDITCIILRRRGGE